MKYKIPTIIYTSKSLFEPSKECWKQLHLRVKEIQKLTKGEGAVLCFLDNGIARNDELLHHNIDAWTYFSNVDIPGEHATHGATIAFGKNLGIFPNIKMIVSKQVLDPTSGTGGTQEIVSAIHKAKEMGLQTINLSLGSNTPDPKIKAALQEFCSNGINIATIASGNDGPGARTTDYPARYARDIKGVISVGATTIDRNGNISIVSFSSRGTVTISAPGHALKTMNIDNSLNYVSGTSFAAPIVGAFIAVARTLVDRDLTQDEILGTLIETSLDIHDTKDNTGSGEIQGLEFLKRIKDIPNNPINVPDRVMKKSWLCKIFGCYN